MCLFVLCLVRPTTVLSRGKVTRMFKQVIADAREKDRQLKKRKVDEALDDARGISLDYINR